MCFLVDSNDLVVGYGWNPWYGRIDPVLKYRRHFNGEDHDYKVQEVVEASVVDPVCLKENGVLMGTAAAMALLRIVRMSIDTR